jgi:hypothetical protein
VKTKQTTIFKKLGIAVCLKKNRYLFYPLNESYFEMYKNNSLGLRQQVLVDVASTAMHYIHEGLLIMMTVHATTTTIRIFSSTLVLFLFINAKYV